MTTVVADKLTARVTRFVESAFFTRFIIAIILANAVTLGLESIPSIWAAHGHVLKAIDRAFLFVFVCELALKLFAYRVSFFKNGWNWFDAAIVAVSLIPNAGPWSVLRALRLFRLFSAVPSMRNVIEALFKALPGMGAIVAVLMVFFYVAAIVATQVFGKDPALAEQFGALHTSAFTLFRIMTLDGWGDLSAATMARFPYAWAFFLPFIVLTSFAVLNLFIAVIVEAMGNQKEAEAAKGPHPATEHDIEGLRVEIRALRDALKERERAD